MAAIHVATPPVCIRDLFKLYRRDYGYDLDTVRGRLKTCAFSLNINAANSPYSPRRRPRPSTLYKQWGKTFAKFLRGPDHDFSDDPEGFEFDWDELREHLNNAPRGAVQMTYRVAIDALNQLPNCYPDDYLRLCEHCEGGVYAPDDMRYSERSDVTFGSCCEDRYTYSELDDDYIHSDYVVAYYDRNPERHSAAGYASERALRNSGDYRYSEYFSEWVSDELWYEYDGEDEDSDEDDDDSPMLRSYHGTTRRFQVRDTKPATLFPPLGVELEVYSSNRYDSVEHLSTVASSVYARAGLGNLIIERDGSLDSYHGFEIVTDPLGKSEWQAAHALILGSLKHTGAEDGTNDPDHQYGIHVNLDRRKCSPLQEARMMMFLCAEENKHFAQVVAQRDNVYNGSSYSIGAFPNRNQKVSQIGGLRIRSYRSTPNNPNLATKKIYGVGKYAPINFKTDPDVAEFRIFRSTIDTVEFMKNLEFVWALYAWTHPSSCSGTSWHYKDFLMWLASNSKQSWQRYPNLLTYLHDETRADDSSTPAPINTYLPREKTTQKPLPLRLAA